MDDRVNIVFVIDRMWGSHGGTEGQLLMLMNGLDKSRFNVHLVCLVDTDWLRKSRLDFPVKTLNVKGLLSVGIIGKMMEFRKLLGEKEAEGIYSNLVLISHSPSEFILDFARVLPGIPKAKVYSRIVMTPQNAKSLHGVLQRNLETFEKKHGKIPAAGTPESTREIGFK